MSPFASPRHEPAVPLGLATPAAQADTSFEVAASAQAGPDVRLLSATAPDASGMDCFLDVPEPVPGPGPWLTTPVPFEEAAPTHLRLDPSRLMKAAVLTVGVALPSTAGAPHRFPSEEARLLAKLQLHDQAMAAIHASSPAAPAPTAPAALPELGIRALEHGVEYQLGPQGRLRLQDALDIRVDPSNPKGLIVRSGDVQVTLAPQPGGQGWSVGRVDPRLSAWSDWGQKATLSALGALSGILIATWASRRWRELERGQEATDGVR